MNCVAMASQNDMFNDIQDPEYDVEGGNDDGQEEEGGENTVEGVLIQERPANDYNSKTNKTVAWQEGELSIIIDAMDDHYDMLVGHVKDHEYRRSRVKAWRNLLTAINNWNDLNRTNLVRSVKSIRTKMRNLRQRSK